MRRAILLALFCLSIPASAQSTDSDEAILARTRALYDTPFLRGLINFDCHVQFDFAKHLEDSFGLVPPNAAPLVRLLEPVTYRVLVDRSGAVASVQGRPPDLSAVPNATMVEEGDRQIIQAGLGQWVAFAYGEILPVGPTKAHFQKSDTGYTIAMDGPGVAGTLQTDAQLHLVSGIIEKPQHIEFVSKFVGGPSGLLLEANTTDMEHSGAAEFHYTYHGLDSFQLPETVTVKSAQGLRWQFTLGDCKVQRGIAVTNLPVTGK